MQVHSTNTTVLDELCDCVSVVASVPVRQLTVHVSFAGEGLQRAADHVSSRLEGVVAAARAELRVLRTANAGADVKPFLEQLSHASARNAPDDLVLKVHSKTDCTWRQHTLSALCGSAEHVHSIYAAFEEASDSLGGVAPQGTVFHAGTSPAAIWPHIRTRYFLGKASLASAFDDETVERMRHLDILLFPGSRRFEHDAQPLIAAGTAFWMRAAALRIPSWVRLLDLSRAAPNASWMSFSGEYQVRGQGRTPFCADAHACAPCPPVARRGRVLTLTLRPLPRVPACRLASLRPTASSSTSSSGFS